MSSPLSAGSSGIGDVDTVLGILDQHLRMIRSGDPASARTLLIDGRPAQLDGADFDQVIVGAGTLVYVYVDWLRQAYEHQGEGSAEALGSVLGYVVDGLHVMNAVEDAAIPTMAGLIVAAGVGLSPNLWRAQYGPWMRAEMNAVEATLLLLAGHVNEIAQDDDQAIRMVADVLAAEP
ncbi:hypothetical protein C1I98_28115 [Spongiactinospora gelatinilytica]|uniref:Uncharacterized protein n=1 Tax=Spongiactinospora gelatinilytica TaxID=2666298 RepID=A0A2W2G1D3_9ACTN|nr:hypothetical protein [Spongiactinospora gelatinilytica]PZG34445.1 hypothetical protein C1I98_28115 [Spongiactinospora gelatinilytica]